MTTEADKPISILSAALLYGQIQEEWPSLKASMPWDALGNRLWTCWALSYFFKKGEDLSFKVEMTDLKDGRGQGEYLVDLCWWKEQDSQYWLDLILESEWNSAKAEIDQDFYKLIDVKARIKVWICSWGERQWESRQSELSRIVRKTRFKFPEEEYLIINMPDSEKPEYRNCLVVQGFWMNNWGTPNELASFKIYRNP